MTTSPRTVRALGLCSGGLDSILSALVLRRQGIDVTWVSFETPFFSAAKARRAAKLNDIPLIVKPITDAYLTMLKNPPAGYGKHMNPCMDCHTLMFRLAGDIMADQGFDFLFSGEVLGQRPMSQVRPSLRYVEKHSGHTGRILRPLSAKKLQETDPEREGLVDRNQLLDFSGRSRKPQIALAAELGVTEYPAPAGGCLLTDKGYSTRLKDLFNHQDTYREPELNMLKFGRHLRLDKSTKVIVGRTQKENEELLSLVEPQEDMVIKVDRHPGPITILPGGGSEDQILRAAAICAGYSKAPNGTPVEVTVTHAGTARTVTVSGTPAADNQPYLL